MTIMFVPIRLSKRED